MSLRSGQPGIGKTVTPKKKVFKTHALMYFSLKQGRLTALLSWTSSETCFNKHVLKNPFGTYF